MSGGLLMGRLRRFFSYKAVVIVALMVLSWLAIGVELMLLVLWPWPSLIVTLVVVGFVAGALVAARWRHSADELVHTRKDAAIDLGLGMAFELQRKEHSGEHPVYDWATEDDTPDTLPRTVPNGRWW